MKNFQKKHLYTLISIIVSLVLMILIVTLFIWLITGDINMLASLGVVLVPILLVLLAFAGAYIIYLGAVYSDKLMINLSNSLKQWLNQPDTTPEKSKALNLDFVDESVHYTVKRLGEKEGSTFLSNNEKGRFIIDGRYITVGDIAFEKTDIQWLGLYKNSTSVRLDVNIDGWWHQISINPGYGGAFLKELREFIPQKLNESRYVNRPDIRSYVGSPAHITTQNLQGIFEKHEAVELYVTPLWMVVLHNGYVIQQHFVDDITDVRSTKHPTDLDDEMLLLSFEVGEEAFAYALKDRMFVTRLTDAAKQGYDTSTTRKKKQQDS